MHAKKFQPVECSCPLKCSSKIDCERQAVLNQKFYALGDWSLQNAFLYGQVKVSSIRHRYTKSAQSRRQQSKFYYLGNSNGEDVRVCKEFFKKVLLVSDGRVSRATSQKKNGVSKSDQRGKHEPHNKTPAADILYVKDFIEKFPTYTSHYSRAKNPNRTYLSPSLNISIMYEMYKTQCSNENPVQKPVSQHKFREVFNESFNISFHPPHQDTCKTCDELKVKLDACNNEETTSQLKTQLEIHHRKADSARHGLQADCKKAKIASENLTTLTFDLQKTLPTPVLSTGICYYKRQLWTYNMGVHDMASDTGYMYLWNESVASRGPNEVASALLCHIKKHVTTENLVLYSDCCGGQNRNVKLVLFWNYVVQNENFPVKCIDHKFLLPGHTFLPNDQDFGIIEKNKRYHSDVYVPQDWITVIKTAKKQKPHFVVTGLDTKNFVNLSPLEESAVKRKVTPDKMKVEWLKIQWIHLDIEHPNMMFFKYSVNEDACFSVVDFSKRARGRPRRSGDNLPVLYPDGRPIQRKKLLDLKSLLSFVPPVHHKFYRGLKEDVNDDDNEGAQIWSESDDDSNP